MYIGWPWVHRDPPASVFQGLGLKVCITKPGSAWYFWCSPKFLSDIVCALVCTLSLLLSTSEGEGHSFLFKEVNQDWCWAFNFVTTAWLIVPPEILCRHGLALLRRIPLTWLQETIPCMVLVFPLFDLPGSRDVRWGNLQAWGISGSPVSPTSCSSFFLFQMSSHSISRPLYLVTVSCPVIAAVSTLFLTSLFVPLGSGSWCGTSLGCFSMYHSGPFGEQAFRIIRHSGKRLRASALDTQICLQHFLNPFGGFS